MGRLGIGEFCMNLMRTHPGMSNEQILDKCRERFPDARTKMSSIYWYRNEVRKENGSSPRGRRAAAAVRPANPRNHRSAEWPDWPAPAAEDVLTLAKITAPYVRFPHPDIVRLLVEDNERRRASWAERLAALSIDPSLYLWARCACAFPGVRRYSGSTEIATYRKRVDSAAQPDNALRLDDNDFPKHLWSFTFRGRPFQKQGPSGYSLAHLADHKIYKNRGRDEFDGTEGDAGALAERANFGLYTSAANTVFIPTGLIRPTDFAFPLRNLIQRRAAELYGGICNLLPPPLAIREAESTDWALANFGWAEPVGTTAHIDAFLDFRRRQIDLMFAGYQGEPATGVASPNSDAEYINVGTSPGD
jgi:hypothetical protein